MTERTGSDPFSEEFNRLLQKAADKRGISKVEMLKIANEAYERKLQQSEEENAEQGGPECELGIRTQKGS